MLFTRITIFVSSALEKRPNSLPFAAITLSFKTTLAKVSQVKSFANFKMLKVLFLVLKYAYKRCNGSGKILEYEVSLNILPLSLLPYKTVPFKLVFSPNTSRFLTAPDISSNVLFSVMPSTPLSVKALARICFCLDNPAKCSIKAPSLICVATLSTSAPTVADCASC